MAGSGCLGRAIFASAIHWEYISALDNCQQEPIARAIHAWGGGNGHHCSLIMGATAAARNGILQRTRPDPRSTRPSEAAILACLVAPAITLPALDKNSPTQLLVASGFRGGRRRTRISDLVLIRDAL